MTIAVLLWVLAGLLVVAGFAGLVLPAMPGAPLIFLGLLAAAWAEDFAHVGWKTLSALAALAALSWIAEHAAGAFGARRFGASGRAALGALVGGLVGIFLGLPGILLGPFVGAVAGELTVRRDLAAAGRAGVGATIGLLLGVAAKVALAVSMVGIFAVVRLA